MACGPPSLVVVDFQVLLEKAGFLVAVVVLVFLKRTTTTENSITLVWIVILDLALGHLFGSARSNSNSLFVYFL